MAGADYFLRGLEMWNAEKRSKREMAQRDKEFEANQQYRRDESRRIDRLARDGMAQSGEQFDSMQDYRYAALEQSGDQFTRSQSHKENIDWSNTDLASKNFLLAEQQLAEKNRVNTANIGLVNERTRGLAQTTEHTSEIYDNEVDRRNKSAKARKLMADEEDARIEMANRSRTNMREFASAVRDGGVHDVTNILLGDKVDPAVLNDIRGNSGKGNGIHVQYEDGYYKMYTMAENEDGEPEYLPFTVDPKNNDSTQLRIPENQLMTVLSQVSNMVGQVSEQDQSGGMMGVLLSSMGGLVADENGEVVTQHVYGQRQEAKAQADAQNKLMADKKAADDAKEKAKGDSIIDGREGGLVDDFVASKKAVVDMAGDVASVPIEFAKDVAFGEKVAPEESPANAIATPEVNTVQWRDFMKKHAPERAASERAAAAKLFGDTKSALEASKSQREKAMDIMIEIDPAFDQAKRRNYIDNGVFLSKAELQAMGFKNKQAIVDYQKSLLELDKLSNEVNENNGSFTVEHLDKLDSVFEDSARINSYGDVDSGELKQTSARYKQLTSNLIMATGMKPSTLLSLEGRTALSNMFRVTDTLQNMVPDGIQVNSLAPAYSMVMSGVDLSDEEAVQSEVAYLVDLSESMGISLEEAANEVAKIARQQANGQ